MEKASKQGVETVVLIQKTKAMTREYVDQQVGKFIEKSPARARARIKHVIVVGKSGNIHRRNL